MFSLEITLFSNKRPQKSFNTKFRTQWNDLKRIYQVR